MPEDLYEVYEWVTANTNVRIAGEMTLYNAMLFMEAYANKYYQDPTLRLELRRQKTGTEAEVEF